MLSINISKLCYLLIDFKFHHKTFNVYGKGELLPTNEMLQLWYNNLNTIQSIRKYFVIIRKSWFCFDYCSIHLRILHKNLLKNLVRLRILPKNIKLYMSSKIFKDYRKIYCYIYPTKTLGYEPSISNCSSQSPHFILFLLCKIFHS